MAAELARSPPSAVLAAVAEEYWGKVLATGCVGEAARVSGLILGEPGTLPGVSLAPCSREKKPLLLRCLSSALY